MIPLGFKCARCGACCEWEGPVRLEADEVDGIAGFLHMDVERFIAARTVLTEDRRSLSLMERPDGSCAFYDREGKSCLINPVKPRQCVRFPASWSFQGWERMCLGAKRALASADSESNG
jgi:uncharacterized protein